MSHVLKTCVPLLARVSVSSLNKGHVEAFALDGGISRSFFLTELMNITEFVLRGLRDAL